MSKKEYIEWLLIVGGTGVVCVVLSLWIQMIKDFWFGYGEW
jgi:hypothetical protein